MKIKKDSEKFVYKFDMEFRELEYFFRQFYLEHPKRRLDEPVTRDEVTDVLQKAASVSSNFLPRMLLDSLEEDIFFQDALDVAIYQHIRYLPAMIHQHRFFEIACVINGTCTNHIVNQAVTLTAGDVCIIAPDTRHTISAFSDDCIILNILLRTSTFEKSFFSIMSENDIISDFFSHTLYQSKEMPYLLFTMEPDPDVYNFIGHLRDEVYRNRRYQKRMVNSILNALFITLLRNHEKDVIIPTIKRSVMNENLMFILRYMQENYAAITLKHLSEFFNYSERQLQRIIKSATGRSFSENILKLKMDHAADMLKTSGLPVADIADRLGYYDSSNFRHIFKKYYGMGPAEFRAGQLNKNMADT